MAWVAWALPPALHYCTVMCSVINRRGRDERIIWMCSKSRTRSGSLCILDDQIISRKDIHNHPPDEAETEAGKIVHVDSMKDN